MSNDYWFSDNFDQECKSPEKPNGSTWAMAEPREDSIVYQEQQPDDFLDHISFDQPRRDLISEEENSLDKQAEQAQNYQPQAPALNQPRPNDHCSAQKKLKVKEAVKKTLKGIGKNSNSIKKIGRIILENIIEYDIAGEVNEGVETMLAELTANRQAFDELNDYGDYFNLSHLKYLLGPANPDVARFNLKTTRRLLQLRLRKDVFKSHQIKGDNKLLYLVTLKCSCIRMTNKDLATRLQIPDIQT